MDILSARHMDSQKQAKRKKKAVKVVYISSPMKVTTHASRFRALVQELTGQESDVARFMEANGADNSWTAPDEQRPKGVGGVESGGGAMVGGGRQGESPTSSDSLFDAMDDGGFMREIEDSFAGMFPSGFLYEYSSQVDGIKSFDAV